MGLGSCQGPYRDPEDSQGRIRGAEEGLCDVHVNVEVEMGMVVVVMDVDVDVVAVDDVVGIYVNIYVINTLTYNLYPYSFVYGSFYFVSLLEI